MGRIMCDDPTTLLTLIGTAVLPWRSAESWELGMPDTYDSQAEIDACCFCTKPECVNCLAGGKQTAWGKDKQFDKHKFVSLIRSNHNMKEVCENTGMSRATYFRYKKLYAKGELI